MSVIAQYSENKVSNGLINVFHFWSQKTLSTGIKDLEVFNGQESAPKPICNLQSGMVPDGLSFNAYKIKLAVLAPVGIPWTVAARQAADDLIGKSFIEFKLNGSLISQLNPLVLETNRPGVAVSGSDNSLLNGSGINPAQCIELGDYPHTWPKNTKPDYQILFNASVPAALNGFTLAFVFIGVRGALNASQIS